MSSSRLGRSKDLEKYWSESLLQRDNIEIESTLETPVPDIPEVENYPYKNQIEVSGDFTYYIPGRKREKIARKGEYAYRTGSGLFIVDIVTDKPRPEEVFTTINDQISSQAKIQDRIPINRQYLWKFLSEADSIEKLQIRGPEGQYDIGVLLELVDEENPRESLQRLADVKQIDYPDNILAALERIKDPNSVSSIEDLNVDLFKISIISADATFRYKKRMATLQYRRNMLTINAESEEAREYLIQIFERDVLPPDGT